MMSISDEVQRLILNRENSMIDADICKMYEEANKSFQELVDKGIAHKRGCQLLPVESTMRNNVDFNVSNP